MRRAALIAGHAVVVVALATALYLQFFGADEPSGPEISLDGGAKSLDGGAKERARDYERESSAATPLAPPAGGGLPTYIGPPDAQYSSSSQLLSLSMGTGEVQTDSP